MEHDRVQRHGREPEAHAVVNAEDLHDLALDAGLLEHLLDRDLRRRIADVGPPRRIEPVPGIGPLDQQDLPTVVAHDCADRDLRRDVARHPRAHRLQPLRPQLGRRQVVTGRMAHVRGDVQHLFETFPLVLALREPEAGSGDARQRLAPTNQLCGIHAFGLARTAGPLMSRPRRLRSAIQRR